MSLIIQWFLGVSVGLGIIIIAPRFILIPLLTFFWNSKATDRDFDELMDETNHQ